MADAIESRFGFVDELPHRIQWLCDNGSAYTAHKTRAFATSPESNGMAESFIKTLKRDCVHITPLNDAKTLLEQLPIWFKDFNNFHLHKALKMRLPREYREFLNKLEQCPV